MIFKPLTTTIEKNAYTISIQNMDVSSGHWGNEKDIAGFLEEVEMLYYDRESFEKNLIKHCTAILKYNIRTEDIAFYRDGRNIVLLTIVDRRSFGEIEFLSRKLEINLKKEGFIFSIIELLKPENEEVKAGTKKLPETWVLDEELNRKLNRYRNFV